MRTWEIISVANTAYRHGQAYAKGLIYRSTGKYRFKMPEVSGLPDYVVHMPFEDHLFLAKVYRHAFRAGLKSGATNE